MDIIKKIKPLKASYQTLKFRHKVVIAFVLVGLTNFSLPHETVAKAKEAPTGLVFYIGDYDEFLQSINISARQNYYEQQLRKQLHKQQLLINEVQEYLKAYNSPLVDVVPTLVSQRNWKKITALANAESSLCRRYPVHTANCWGVGGSDLWDMGENLNDGVTAMNKFLENHPRRSKYKYSQMSFEQMNGLYKQPARDHWVVNNKVIYNDLSDIEKRIMEL